MKYAKTLFLLTLIFSFTQTFALPIPDVVSPNGGEEAEIGTIVSIDWSINDPDSTYYCKFYWSDDDFNTSTLIDSILGIPPGPIPWQVPEMTSNSLKIRFELTDSTMATRYDDSDGYFHTIPSVQITYPVGGEEIWVAEDVTITWNTEEAGEIDYTVVRFDDGTNPPTVIDTAWGQPFELDWTTPVMLNDECRIHLKCVDTNGNYNRDESDDFSLVPRHEYKNVAAGWSLISIPLIPVDPDVNEVFGDDFVHQYVLYGFTPEQGHYIAEDVEMFKGYFLGTVADGTLEVEGLPNVEDEHSFDLVWGWNMLGTPFRSGAHLCDATVNATINGHVHTLTFEEAVDETLLTPVAYYFYNNLPDTVLPPDSLARYFDSCHLRDWHGYWYLALTDSVELIVTPEGDPHPAPPVRDDVDDGRPADWYLDVTAVIGNFADQCRLGVDPEATASWDNRFDYATPPAPPNDYVQIYFEREDWYPAAGSLFNRDIRTPLERGDTENWDFTVLTGQDSEVTLYWNRIDDTTPWMNEYTLMDPGTGQNIDMKSEDSYSFNVNGNRQLRIQVHSSLDVQNDMPIIPQEFSIVSTHPNPFNSTTIITYSLPVDGTVKLTVFDLAGREIAELVNGKSTAGIHEVSFNGDNLQSGIYLVRLSTSERSTTSKLTLIK